MATSNKHKTIQRGTFVVVDVASPFRRLQVYGEVVRQTDARISVSCHASGPEVGLLADEWTYCNRRSDDFELLVNFPFIEDKVSVPAALVGIERMTVELDLSPPLLGSNQRVTLRANMFLPVSIQRQDFSFRAGHTIDVSGAGVQVKLDGALTKQEFVSLTMAMPIEHETDLQSKARVIWSKRLKEDHLFGLLFIDLETNEVKRLCRLALRAVIKGE